MGALAMVRQVALLAPVKSVKIKMEERSLTARSLNRRIACAAPPPDTTLGRPSTIIISSPSIYYEKLKKNHLDYFKLVYYITHLYFQSHELLLYMGFRVFLRASDC